MGKCSRDKLRNLGIVGHGGCGKTTLAETLLFMTGVTDRLGRVDDGTSVMDYEPEEVKRKLTLSSSLNHFDWKGTTFNIIDTPGYTNFLHDTRDSLSVVDGVLLVAPVIGGVKAQDIKIWEWANEYQVPRVVFVNQMEREGANFEPVVKELSEAFSTQAVAVTMPIGAEAAFQGVINLITMKAYTYNDASGGKATEGEIPAELKDEAETMRVVLMEAVSEADDALMEKYLETEELSSEEILDGLKKGVRSCLLTPVLCGSTLANKGLDQLLDCLATCLPSPADRKAVIGKTVKGDAEEERPCDEQAPFAARVFKTISDPFTGKLTLFRIYSGTLKSDSNVYNPNRDASERIGQIFYLEGKKQKPTDEAAAGDIVAVAKLKATCTGDTLCDAAKPILLPSPTPMSPVISFALEAQSKGDQDKIHSGLQRLIEEDPTLQMLRDEETHELILSGMGQLHLEVAMEKLKRKFGVGVELKEPKVPYRETIKGKAKLQSKYKKQSGGRGQYADAWIEVEPNERGGGYEFVDKIVGGVIPRQYIPAVDKGIQEASVKGILAGYPVVDFKVTLFDGSYHDVDSSEMAFKIAGSMGFKKAMEQANPILLEPIVRMDITVPDECMGDVIGDINSRRGRVLGFEAKGGNQVISVNVPMASVLKYSSELGSMTSDRGLFTMEFSHYEEVPAQMAEKVIEQLKRQQEE
ncbi:MAG: elongation factor G [Desulfuromonadaceae bacterium]|nr:elongation factor G [Desulfuromonadaceae bacterium]